MPKIVSPDELRRLIEILGRFPDGASVEDLLTAMGGAVSRRTLQRRLADLVEQGRVAPERAWRSIRYRLAPRAGMVRATSPSYEVGYAGDAYVPVSPQGEEIRAYVRRPVQGRRPVGYELPFLEAYQPNQTCYLPAPLREQLHRLGRSPAEAAPAGTFARDILNHLLIDLSWASSRLEGNTYNRLDTERLIRFGEAAAGKDALETQMILNHKAAIEYLVRDAEQVACDAPTVIALHACCRTACWRIRWPAAGCGTTPSASTAACITRWRCRSASRNCSASCSAWRPRSTTRSSRPSS